MTTNEIFFLILVCCAFGALAFGLAVGTIVFRRSLVRPAAVASRRRDARLS